MTVFVKATYYPEQRAAEFVTAEGRRLIRRGGSLCWLLNNCGNLVAPMKDGQPAPKKTRNYVGFAQAGAQGHHFFIFKSYQAGREEVKAWFRRRNALTLAQCIEAYAPSHENNTSKYIADLQHMSGIAHSSVIGTLSDAQLEQLVDALERKEGYHKDADTRQEKWVEATSITATNGTAPIAGLQLQVERAGQSEMIQANAYGQFRPVPHLSGASTLIKVRKPDGSWQKLLELTEKTASGAYRLVQDWFSVTATMQSDQAPSQAKRKKSPLQYRVKPGDSLSKIARQFHTGVDELKKHNRLQSELIHPDQLLWVYGRGVDVGAKMPRPVIPKSVQPAADKPAANPSAKGRGQADTAPVVRGQGGEGKPLALVTVEPGRAPWMVVAMREAQKWAGHYESKEAENLTEKRKRESQGLIETNYHAQIKDGQADLRTAWCAAFVNYCLKEAGYGYERSASSQFAVNSKQFVKIDKPVYGALVVYRHTKKKNGTGHVGFVYHRINKVGGEDNYAILGGNQGDQITLAGHLQGFINDPTLAKLVGYYVPVAYLEYAQKMMDDPADLGEEVKLPELQKTTKISYNTSKSTQ